MSYSLLLPEHSIPEQLAHEDDSMFCCSIESDVDDLVTDNASLLLDAYSSADDSEDDSDEILEQQSPESPRHPEISYLSFSASERSVHNVHGQLETQDSPAPAPVDVQPEPWHGYSIYGDNIDKNVYTHGIKLLHGKTDLYICFMPLQILTV